MNTRKLIDKLAFGALCLIAIVLIEASGVLRAAKVIEEACQVEIL